MFFRKGSNKEEIEKVKKAMKESESGEETRKTIEPRKEEKSRDFAPKKTGGDAPLFIKVEKYKKLLSRLQEMKNFVSGVKQSFTILDEVERVKEDSLKILRVTVQRLERTITEMDNELLRPEQVHFETSGKAEAGHMERSLGDLQDQLSSLRKELNKIEQ